VVRRGELWWADLGVPVGSAPGYRRPVLVVSSDRFNSSRLATVVVAAVTSNLRLGDAPGNVVVDEPALARPSVVNVTQLLTIDRQLLEARIAMVTRAQLRQVDSGLRLSLGL